MPKHPPPPGYHRPNLLLGWPDGLRLPTFDAHATPAEVDELWRQIQRGIIMHLCLNDTANLPPLGTFAARENARLTWRDVYRDTTCPRRHLYRFTFRPSDMFRSAVAGQFKPGRPRKAWAWCPLMDEIAIAAQIQPARAKRVWALMAAAIIKAISRGGSLDAKGFGIFAARKRAARTYRYWRTGQLRTAPAMTLPHFMPSPSARDWIAAGGIPEPL